MQETPELITASAFGRALIFVCAAWVVVSLTLDLVAHLRRRPVQLPRVLCRAALGPLVLALWAFYCWMVRPQPQAGYVGLHSVWVFVCNLAVFLAVGLTVGVLLARLARPMHSTEAVDRPDPQ